MAVNLYQQGTRIVRRRREVSNYWEGEVARFRIFGGGGGMARGAKYSVGTWCRTDVDAT